MRAIQARSSTSTIISATTSSPTVPNVRSVPPLAHMSLTSTRVCLAFPEKNAVKHCAGPRPRHHSDDDVQYWLVRGNDTRLFRITFSFLATISLAIVRFKVRLVKSRKQFTVEVEVEVVDCVGRDALLSPIYVPCSPSGGSSACVSAVSNGPLVVRLFLSRFSVQ